MERPKVFIGVAWPYANGAIHMGHLAGSLLPPDIFCRYHRLKGHEVLMVSGSDQHGTPVTVRADKEGSTPEQVAERYHEINKKAIEDLGIEFSLFTKTHTQNHINVVHDIFLTLLKKGYLEQRQTMQYYCHKCAKFLPDRYVEGKCVKCGNENSRSDQCDNCGTTFEVGDVVDPVCINCGSRPEMREAQHYFFKLTDFEQPLLSYVQGSKHWRSNVQLFTQNWLESGLKDRPITRDMTWGVPVPLPGTEGKVIYVWFEAVIGYLSASKEWAQRIGRPDAWKDYWMDPEIKSYYFLGKDNIPFHTIIWPSILMGYGGLNLPYDVPANEFLTFKEMKLSKSKGPSIDIPSILKLFDADLLRYYMSINMPEGKDADFSWEDFETKINNELVATLGNYFHRVLSFTQKNFKEVPPLPEGLEAETKLVDEAIAQALLEMDTNVSICQFKKGLKAVMDLAQFGNRFFDSVAPWSLLKTDKEKCGGVLHLNLRIVQALAVLANPYLPFSTQKLWGFLANDGKIADGSWEWATKELNVGRTLPEPKPLYKKVEMPKEESPFSAFESLDLRVGLIEEVSDHPNADKLMVLKVNIGRPIQLVAGLKAFYSKEELTGKKVVVITNLQPAKLRGVESQGMVLAAEAGEKVKVLTPSGPADPGDKVTSGLNPGSKVLSFSEFQAFVLRTGTVVDDKEADLGYRVKADTSSLVKGKQAAFFLPKEGADVALPLYTEKKVSIGVDGELDNGAKVR
ncbi:MAG: methionine--tRNA ligase [Methanomassiliicoccales archaeon]|nr:methionine--tRNA ligase [Methanomassiliicoccales archaeon]